MMIKTVHSGLLNLGRRAYQFKEDALQQLAQKNYHTARRYYHYKLRRADQRHYKDPPLLVYQMGKVGSSSVTMTLREANLDRHIYHIHFLTPELIEKYEKKRKGFFATSREGDLKHIWQYQHLYKQIKRGLNGRKWKVVTLVRDPVARNLSTFFEHIEIVPSASDREQTFRSVEYGFEVTIENGDLEPLIDLFFEKCRHDTPIIYFDREFKTIFDIDLFASDFPKTKGYQIYEAAEADILLIKLEYLDQCTAEAFKAFLNIDNLSLVRHNVGSQKETSDIYQLFKESINLPESYIDHMYASKVAQHFYTEAEISRFRAKWSGRA